MYLEVWLLDKKTTDPPWTVRAGAAGTLPEQLWGDSMSEAITDGALSWLGAAREGRAELTRIDRRVFGLRENKYPPFNAARRLVAAPRCMVLPLTCRPTQGCFAVVIALVVLENSSAFSLRSCTHLSTPYLYQPFRLCSSYIMPSLSFDQPGVLHIEYKKAGAALFANLDPEGQLNHTRHDYAAVARRLVRELPIEERDAVYDLATKAIELRTTCSKYYKFAPILSQEGHEKYIKFLNGIKEQLRAYKNDQKAVIAIKEHDLVEKAGRQMVVDVKEQWLEEEQQSQGAQQAKEASMQDGREVGDDDSSLTLAQTDFLSFLDFLMALTRNAAALWKEVVQDKLPIWVASTCGWSPFGYLMEVLF